MGRKTFSIRETATFEYLAAPLAPGATLEPAIAAPAKPRRSRASFGTRSTAPMGVTWPSEPARKPAANRFAKALSGFWRSGSSRGLRRD
jgi:hypothetical protein